jgi:type II secretory pathway component PulM
MFDRLRDMWERLGPRERRLGGLLAVVLVVCGVLYVGFMIQDGLHDLERHNDDTRAILATLNNRREELIEARSKQGETTAMIGEEHTALPTYLEKVGTDVGVSIRAQTEKPTVARGKFHEHQSQITLFDVSLDQLAKFLRGIETQNPSVVVQRLQVKRSALQKEKLDKVELTVATFSRAPSTTTKKPAAAAADKPAAPAPAPEGAKP